MTESMSVLTDPAILNSELTNCPRTAAVLGELAAQWQQMMGPFNELSRRPCHHRAWQTPSRTSAGHGPMRLLADYD